MWYQFKQAGEKGRILTSQVDEYDPFAEDDDGFIEDPVPPTPPKSFLSNLSFNPFKPEQDITPPVVNEQIPQPQAFDPFGPLNQPEPEPEPEDDSHIDSILAGDTKSHIHNAIEQMDQLEKENPDLEIDIVEPKKPGEDVAISTQNLNFYYGGTQALKNVNINIPLNKVTALVGPSGCGKSTFLRCLNRMNDFVPNTRVEGNINVNFDDKDIYDKKTDVNVLRQKVGMITQKPNVFPSMSIYNNVAYGLRLQGIDNDAQLKQMVISALQEVGLYDEVADRLNQNAANLSGGQQQRLCIARAVAVNPSILLMDEPCSALDPKSTKIIEELISKLKEKFTIVIVTHNMQQAQRVSDQTAMFFEGTVDAAMSTEQFFSNPPTDLAKEYVAGYFS